MGAVYVAKQTGSVGIAFTALVLLVFQWLIAELLKSKQRGDQLHRVATTDELTGLANRERFRARLDQRIAAAKTTDEGFAVMLLDLDRFKEVNDTLGHHFGDELLRDLGPRLAEAIGPDGLVARLGGDEVAVLPAESTNDTEEIEEIARRMIRCVQQPVVVDEMTLEVGVSIGVSRFPRDGGDPHSLLRSADVAMYAAKEAHAGCKVYAAALDRHSVRRLSVLSEFRRALDSDEIVVFYQPIMHMDPTRPHGAEGLVRWQHPELGLLPPSDFLPIVEQTGLIGPLTRHVLEQAVAQCALANLRRLPIDELKIDRSFVSPMLSDESDLIIVRSTINLGHDLGLKVVAEGVEDEATLHRLAGLGCDFAQGYHFSKPLAAAAFDKWIDLPALAPSRRSGPRADCPSGPRRPDGALRTAPSVAPRAAGPDIRARRSGRR
jgi:diguanylate cyclase (GGDEF)-like protein